MAAAERKKRQTLYEVQLARRVEETERAVTSELTRFSKMGYYPGVYIYDMYSCAATIMCVSDVM